MQSLYIQRVMMIKPYCGFGKTKPIKANNQSSLITNHLEGKTNFENSNGRNAKFKTDEQWKGILDCVGTILGDFT